MKLEGKKVAIMATDGFEKVELFSPLEALKNEGAEVHIVSDKSGEIKSWDEDNWGESINVDKTFDDFNADDYNALVVPGGVINPDKLRTNDKALNIVKDFMDHHKPVGSICHGPQILINAGVVKDRKMTSYHSIKQDMENAGVNWVDEEVVVDQGLVTSRNPSDLQAFNKKLIEEIREGRHDQ